MDFIKNKPPRRFKPSVNSEIQISDCGKIKLEDNEQISFLNENKKEYDFVAKEWGYYATPSINGRLLDEGFKTALVRNNEGKYFIMAVEDEKIKIFKKYLQKHNQKIIKWLNELI